MNTKNNQDLQTPTYEEQVVANKKHHQAKRNVRVEKEAAGAAAP